MSKRGPRKEVRQWVIDRPGELPTIRDDAPDWAKEEWNRYWNSDDLIEMSEEDFENYGS